MSIFDAPQYDLNPMIWSNTEGSYVLRDRIKNFLERKIYQSLAENLCASEDWLKDIVLFGSLTTNQYNPKSNMDVGILVDLPIFLKTNPYFEDKETKQVLRLIKKILENSFTSHTLTDSINQVIPHVMEKDALFLGDSIYTLTDNKWLKKPLIIDWKFDPWESFKKEIKYCMELAQEIFPLISDARVLSLMYLRTSRGYDNLVEAIKNLCYIEYVMRLFRDRKNTNKGVFPAYSHSNNWDYHNVVYKILQSWKIAAPTDYILKEFPELRDVIQGIKSEFNFKEDVVQKVVDDLEKKYFNS